MGRGKQGRRLRIRRGEHNRGAETRRLQDTPVARRPGLFFALVLLVALVAIVVTSQAPATPGVFSLDRLRLGSTSGPENYLYTAGNTIYPDGGIDAGANYYKVVVTDTLGTIRNPGFPCTPGANFATANNSYTVSPSDPVSNSVYWKYTLQQFANSSCTGTPAKSAFLQFDVAKLTSWADAAMTTQKSVFAPGSSVYVTVAGMKPTQANVPNTWILPSSATACANTVGGDRANIDGFGRLPSTVGGYLLYAPGGSSNAQWNRTTSYDGPCPAMGIANEGQWSVRFDMSPTVFVTLPAFTVDATAPPTPSINSTPPNPSNSGSAQFTFSDSESGVGFNCRVDGGSYAACTSPKSFTGLGDGAHTFQVLAVDAAGNQSTPASYSWTVDATPPDTSIDSGPTGTVNSTNASFTFSSEAGASFDCNLDGGGFSACTSPKNYSGLSDSAHTFQARARDAAGNIDPTPATRTWTVDTTPPPAPSIDSGPPDPSPSASATFNFSDSEGGVSFNCRLDGGSYASCTSPKSYSGLSEGLHTFEVLAVDAAGNQSAAGSRSWTIDLPPVVSLVTPADGSSTNDSTPTFSGTAGAAFGDSVTVTVKVYAGSAPSGTPVQTLSATRDSFGAWSVDSSPALANGTYTAQAQQSDLGGNVGLSNANTFVVTQGDIAPPDVVLSTPADGAMTNDSTPTFAGTAGIASGDLSTVTVKIYQGGNLIQTRSTSADGSGAFTVDAFPALADGAYSAQAEQSDASGNVGHSAQHAFTVDTAPPSATIDSGPSGTVSSDSASFTFSSEAGATFECDLDGGGFTACTSPKSYSGLSEGAHTFRVRARDAAGNVDPTPAARTWTVDTIAPPTPTIDSGPPTPSPSASATFLFSDSEPFVTFRCRIDGGGFSACSSPKNYSGLVEGQHTFELVAQDATGNTSGEAAYAWTVDTVTPTVTLTSPANGSTTPDATPPFSGTAGTAAGDSTTVTVKVYTGSSPTGTPARTMTTTRGSGGAYSVDASPALTKGTYTAQAEQSDSAGHTGLSSPATFTLDSPAYRREVLADNPRAFYRLGEASGTVLTDETGTNPGTYVNGVALGQSGALATTTNTAALFDGVNDYATVPDSNSLDLPTAATLEAWVKRSTSGVWQVVASKPGNGQSKFENYAIWINTTNNLVAFFGDGVNFVRVNGPVIDTNWHYVAATYDNATARIYVDGALFASATSTVQMATNALPLNIGRTSSNTNFFGGMLDDVAIYGTALSAGRIQAHYNAATTFDSTAPTVTLTAPTNGFRTDDTTPTFSGIAGNAGGDSTTVTVKVYAGVSATGTPVQTLTATRGAGGAYSVDASPPLPEGTYTARAEQVDESGNLGLSSANTFMVTFGDVTPPVVTLTSPPNGSQTNDMTPAFSGVGGTTTGDSTAVTIKIYPGTTASGTPVQTLTTTRNAQTGAYTVDSAFLDAYTYTARAQQSDQAGNVGFSAPTTFSIPSAYRAAIMADNPRAFWRLGESGGTTAVDETSVNPGTYNNVGLNAQDSLTGDLNTSASFDGLTSYMVVPDSNSLDASTGVTVEAWVKHTKVSVWQELVGKAGDGASKNENYSLWLNPLDHAVAFFGNGSTFVRVETAAPIDTSWHYVVATYDNGTAKIYTDGVLQASAPSTVHLTPNNLPLNIGRINAGGSYYGGLIDEVAVYGTALSISQIQAHFNAANLFDTTAPVVTLSTPDQGTTTKDTTPAFAGMAATTSRDSSAVTLNLYAGSTATGTPIQTLSASIFPTGTWSISAPTALANGTYTAQAQQSDTSGNVGLTAAKTFTVLANPPPTTDPVMIGAGDIGDCETMSDDNVGLLLDNFPSAVVFTTGDNAYPNGTIDQFNNCLDPAWGRAKARIRPAIGGHEYQTDQAAGYFTYYANQLAPFGPTATDYTKAYYSYDLGTWHVIVLNTECVGLAFCSVPNELAWASADLDAHPAPCTLAIMPNPRFSSGDVHGNNASVQPFWDLLNQKGIDLAVSSDDHIYERYAPQNALGAYDPAHGVREFIVGTGGSSHYSLGIRRENSEVEDHHTFGVLKLTLHNGSYEWEFVPAEGAPFTDSGSAACH